jgi:hypothetical protein
MIQGIIKTKNEQEYRATLMDSSSSLKIFSQDRKKYFKFFIEGNTEDVDDDTKAILTGKVVEVLLLEPEKFDDKFYLSACANSPTGLMEAFVEALYSENLKATDEEGNCTKTFEEMSKEAYLTSGFKIKYEAVINKFCGSDAEIYYNEICNVRANNLIVVTLQDVTNTERIVEELKTNPITSGIVNLVDDKRYTVKNQFQVEGFEIDDHKFKAMFDKLVIDHQEKTVQVYDLKCTWSVENFVSEYYLYRRAYIQAYIYWRAILQLVIDPICEFYNYHTLPPKFIVCDSINYYSPLIYDLTIDDLNDAYLGFEYKGKKYPGVKEIIEDLNWSMDNNIWNISRKNYLSNGIVKLKE